MADVNWTTLHDVVKTYGLILEMTATSAVKAGQVVCICETGVSNAVIPWLGTSGSTPVGVAIYPAAAAAQVAIASVGSICLVADADGTTGIDAGGWLVGNDNPAGGTVNETLVAITSVINSIGFALADIAGGATGYALITPQA
jgi:hypothetical protein